MSVNEDDFAALLARTRSGDTAAAAELVQRYEPVIRRVVRSKIVDKRLYRVFDTMDICQSVLGSFFVRAGMGEYEFSSQEDLIRLLSTMARHKLASAARKEYQQKRDAGRMDGAGADRLAELPGRAETASMIVGGQELLDRARALLRDDEAQIAELRRAGQSWDEIASELGGTAQARRVQFMRAVARVSRHLGIAPEQGDDTKSTTD